MCYCICTAITKYFNLMDEPKKWPYFWLVVSLNLSLRIDYHSYGVFVWIKQKLVAHFWTVGCQEKYYLSFSQIVFLFLEPAPEHGQKYYNLSILLGDLSCEELPVPAAGERTRLTPELTPSTEIWIGSNSIIPQLRLDAKVSTRHFQPSFNFVSCI